MKWSFLPLEQKYLSLIIIVVVMSHSEKKYYSTVPSICFINNDKKEQWCIWITYGIRYIIWISAEIWFYVRSEKIVMIAKKKKKVKPIISMVTFITVCQPLFKPSSWFNKPDERMRFADPSQKLGGFDVLPLLGSRSEMDQQQIKSSVHMVPAPCCRGWVSM